MKSLWETTGNIENIENRIYLLNEAYTTYISHFKEFLRISKNCI